MHDAPTSHEVEKAQCPRLHKSGAQHSLSLSFPPSVNGGNGSTHIPRVALRSDVMHLFAETKKPARQEPIPCVSKVSLLWPFEVNVSHPSVRYVCSQLEWNSPQ